MKLVLALAMVILTACSQQADDGGGPRAAPASTTSTASIVDGPRAAPASLPVMTVYKSPTCGCCQSWVDAVKAAGFAVDVHDVNDVTPVKDDAGVPSDKRACHTAIIDGYVIEGHVPPETIKKFLAEHPKAAGLAVPGMPVGAPGMEVPGQEPDHYDVIAFQADGKSSVYESH